MAARVCQELRSSQRHNTKRRFDDYISTTPEKPCRIPKQNEHCTNCNDVFTTKKLLKQHQKKCLALTDKDSFGKHVFNHNSYDTTDKQVVSSQPLAPLSPTTPTPSNPAAPPRPTLTPRTYVSARNATVRIEPLENPRGKQQPITSEQQQQPTSESERQTMEIIREPNLPEYEHVPMLPNKPYNGLSGNDLTELVSNIYEETIRWKKNMFQLPSGKCGKEYIKILTQWLEFLQQRHHISRTHDTSKSDASKTFCHEQI